MQMVFFFCPLDSLKAILDVLPCERAHNALALVEPGEIQLRKDHQLAILMMRERFEVGIGVSRIFSTGVIKCLPP